MPAGPFAISAEPPPRSRLRPTIELSDLIANLWRQRFVMAAVFVVIVALGFAFAMTLKKTYSARSSLLVQLGQEYVYNPRVGDAARGAAPTNDQVIQSEVEILQASALKERVIKKVGLGRLFPAAGKTYAKASPDKRREIEGEAIRGMETKLKIGTAPDNAVVRLSYDAPDSQVAADTLNTLVDEYLQFRRRVLADRDVGAITRQRQDFEKRLAVADAAYETFLGVNGIGDFDNEKASLGQLYSSLLTERYALQAQLSEVQARLGVTARNAAAAPAEIGLFRDVDQTSANKLQQLRIDRQDLLSRYKPDAQPVREIDQKIAALQALTAPAGDSARRMGVNPIYQTLETERNQLQAQAASLRSRQAAVAAGLAQVGERRRKLTELEPKYQDLARERDVLSANVRAFIVREQEGQAAEAVAQTSEDNVRVIERAYPPVRGSSLRKVALGAAIVFGAFAALCVGLLRALLTQGFSTSASVERAADLPVLVRAPLKPAMAR